MPRPRLFRNIRFEPSVNYFKPAGVPLASLEETVLTLEEFEAIRLKDFEGLEQGEASKKMNISQPTFSRLLESGRKKLASAIVKGQSIKIQGGSYKMVTRGRGLGRGFGRGGGQGLRRGRAFGPGPGGTCVCQKCGYEMPKRTGMPCLNQKCPKCGNLMIRKGLR